jgi:hypothetical protein
LEEDDNGENPTRVLGGGGDVEAGRDARREVKPSWTTSLEATPLAGYGGESGRSGHGTVEALDPAAVMDITCEWILACVRGGGRFSTFFCAPFFALVFLLRGV